MENSASHGQRRSPRRTTRLPFFVMLGKILQLSTGFHSQFNLKRPPILFRRSTFATFSKLDDLMDEVLSSRFSVNNETTTSTDANNNKKKVGWRRIDWKQEEEQDISYPAPPPSPVDVVMIRDRLVHIKRDDQIRLAGSQISGNKARKMLALQRLHPLTFPTHVVSYGGPQSNSMLALAAVVHFQNTQLSTKVGDPKEKHFVYYTKKLPRFLRNQPSGNLFRAMSLGMELIELSSDEYNALFGSEWGGSGDTAPINLDPPTPGDSVYIPQGGACSMAVTGTRHLAREILEFWTAHGANQPLSVCIPCGTCSTAVLVHRALKELQATVSTDDKLDIEVIGIPCVGEEVYARRQMMYLNSQVLDPAARLDDIPAVLRPTPKSGLLKPEVNESGYFRFGEPDAQILKTFRELRDEHDLVVDLLYGAPAWTILFRHWTSSSSLEIVHKFDPEAPMNGRRIMFVHSGGLEGINSQMLRYKYKQLVDMDEIQLPGRNSKS